MMLLPLVIDRVAGLQSIRRSLLSLLLAGLGVLACAQPEGAIAPAAADARGADLLLITIDTLRADAPGFAGNAAAATPTLDRLAAGGRVFPDAHAHSVVTLPSHANILTGRYPYQHGVRDNAGFVLPDDVPTLATLLRDAGYTTGAFVAAYPLDSRFGLDRGFDVYDDRYPRGSEPTSFLLAERPGPEVVAAALAWWRQQAGRKRFLWLHLFEPHFPYAPPEPFASRFAGRPYHGEVAAADAALAPLLGPILDGVEPPVLVLLTSDHGEALGEHGEATHGLFAYESTLRVPLVLWGPGIASGRDGRPAGHVDLLPTVLDALGLDAAAAGSELPGRSLLSPAASDPDSPPLYFEALTAHLNHGWAPLRGVLHEGYKLIELPLPELYHLPADPGEMHNRVDPERRRFQQQRALLPAESAWPPPRSLPVSAQEAARLGSLGYLTASAPVRERYGPEDDPKNLVDLEQTLQQVVAHYQTGRPVEAARLAREVLARRPATPLAHSLLAQALLDQGRTDEALEAMEAARREHLATPALLRQLALTRVETGRPAEAIALLEPRVDAARKASIPPDPADLTTLAIALSAAGRQEPAASAVQAALAADPDDPRALETAAMIALRRQRPAEAETHLNRALAHNPRLPNCWNMLAVVRYQSGDGAAALDAWQRSLALNPHQYDVLFNLGLVAPDLGRPDLARRALEQFLAEAPKSAYGADRERARQLLERLGREARP